MLAGVSRAFFRYFPCRSSVAAVLSPILSGGALASASSGESTPLEVLLRAGCLRFRDKCFGAFNASGTLTGQRAALQLSGDMLSGRLDYQPASERPLDVAISMLVLDRLLDLPAKEHDATVAAPDSWVDAIETQHVAPVAIPDWLAELPNGRLRLADISVGGTRFGPVFNWVRRLDKVPDCVIMFTDLGSNDYGEQPDCRVA